MTSQVLAKEAHELFSTRIFNLYNNLVIVVILLIAKLRPCKDNVASKLLGWVSISNLILKLMKQATLLRFLFAHGDVLRQHHSVLLKAVQMDSESVQFYISRCIEECLL